MPPSLASAYLLLLVANQLGVWLHVFQAPAPSSPGDGISNVLIALIGIVPAILTYLGTRPAFNRAIKERDEFRDGITMPVRIPRGEKRSSVMLLGIGGAGKTSLIRNLFNDPNANPNERTEDYEIYRKRMEIGQDNPTLNYFISDYKGQNLGTLVRAFVVQQKLPFSPMAYGYINALVLMVDIVPPPRDQGGIVEPRDQCDQSRIGEHLRQWNDLALDAVFGLVTDTLKCVILFINKYDLVVKHDQAMRGEIQSAYEPLINRIQARAQGARFEVILGSAMHGDGIPRVNDLLMEFSVSNKIGTPLP
jgi:hypothetical protein